MIEEIAREPTRRFLEELNRTISFLQGQRRDLAPSKLVMFGGGAAVKNICKYLGARVELPVECWNLGSTSHDNDVPCALLGPAIALSSLAWASK